MKNTVAKSEHLDPRWQKLRLEVMNRDGWKCVACDASDITLNVHHIRYGYHLWDVCMDDLQTLCRDCHKALGNHPKGGAHYVRRLEEEGTTELGFFDIDVLYVAYRHCPLCGWEEHNCHSGSVIFTCECKIWEDMPDLRLKGWGDYCQTSAPLCGHPAYEYRRM